MSTRQVVEQLNAAPEQSRTGMISLSNAPARENTNSVEQDPGLQARFAKGKSVEDWKIERLENFAGTTQAVNSMNSYKAQNENFSEPIQPNSLTVQVLWAEVQKQLMADLGTAAYETWLKPCRPESLGGNTITLATSSDFNRNIITRRYGIALREAFSTLLGQAVTLRIVADPALEVPLSLETPANSKPATVTKPSPKPQYPLARFQNPTNNPEVAALWNKSENGSIPWFLF